MYLSYTDLKKISSGEYTNNKSINEIIALIKIHKDLCKQQKEIKSRIAEIEEAYEDLNLVAECNPAEFYELPHSFKNSISIINNIK